MAKCDLTTQLNILTCKKENIFQRITRLYDVSKSISNFESRKNEKFISDSETVDELRSKFESILDEINNISLKIDPSAQPNYQALDAFEDLYSPVKRTRNKILQCHTSISSNISINNSSPAPPIKLPPINIPSFDGKNENWPLFYESFKANIHNNQNLTDSQRVQYLISKLSHGALHFTAGIVPTGETYHIIWDSLVKKYQDKRALGTHYLNNIFELKNCTNTANSLNIFIEKFSASIAALKQLDIPDLTDFILLYLAFKKIDSQTIQHFEMSLQSQNTEIPSYTQFIEFIQYQVKVLERTKATNPIDKSNKLSANSRNTYKAFVARNSDCNDSTFKARSACILCKSDAHQHLYNCKKFLEMGSPQARFDFIKSNNMCVNCLSHRHTLGKCISRSFCTNCLPAKKRHHSSLCFKGNNDHTNDKNISMLTRDSAGASNCAPALKSPETSQALVSLPSESSISFCDKTSARSSVLLSTAQVYATSYNNQKKVTIRCLLDTGSQNNIISLKCCKLLKLPITPIANSCIKGIGLSSQPVHGYVYLNIESRVYPANKYCLKALVLDCLTDKLPSYFIESCSNMDHIKDLPLADLSWNTPSGVDVILGAQLFPHIYLGDKIIPSCPAPAALLTTFGYVLMGDYICDYSPDKSSFTALALNELEINLQKFWELEQITNKRHLSPEETECENLYQSSVSRDEHGRFSVALPFCKDASELGNSRGIAHRRLLSLERKFKADPSLRHDYNQVINEYIERGYLSEIPEPNNINEGYYIPHHAVIRPEKTSSRVRIVTDASAKTPDKNISLNDVLHSGPNLQADLFLLLLNFRLFPIAMTADIKQMYMQIATVPRDRKYLKILFRFNDDEKIRTFQFNRVPFGLKSSPYLAMRSVRQLCKDEGHRFPEAAKVAESQLYMDDLVHSAPDEHTAKALAQELIALFKSGAFDLVKWTSNSSTLFESLPDTHRLAVEFSESNNTAKVLGLSWEPKDDTFCLTVSKIDENCTKRTILSFVARLFDVLGLVAPVILYAKLLIKELWLDKVDWDDTPSEDIIKRYLALIQDFSTLPSLRIPRHTGITEGCKVNIVAFCDASLNGYGCVVYLHITDAFGNIKVNLLCSKSKVSPTKITTLARLELCAALLLSKLVKVVKDNYSTRIPIEGIYAFSDSTIALSWIKSSPHRWNTFVSNRVAQCQENLDPQHFYHVAGIENPSDCLSRGVLPSQLVSHPLWWNGPEWLHDAPSNWPINKFSPTSDELLPEFKTKALITTNVQCEQPILYALSQRFSSWNKLIRSASYVLRFARLLPSTGEVNQLNMVENAIIKDIQMVHFSDEIKRLNKKQLPSKKLQRLAVFIDNEGILRIGGRLSQSDLPFEVKHPVLLPKHDHAVNLIIDHYHVRNCHTGPSLLMSLIRQRFWILDARTVIRARVHQCNTCFRVKPSHPTPIMADLPSYRIQEAKAFVHTGIDHAGPIRVIPTRRRGYQSQKAYICLFVCMVTKAVHVELSSDLTAESFIMALKRFLSRKGPVSCLYTDNSGTFIKAKSQLDEIYSLLTSSDYLDKFKSELQMKRIEWKRICPRSPHMAGIWESNIKSLKTHLYRVIGNQLLTYEELLTVLTQIECILNSRPLCLMSSDPQPEILTPAHFLMSTPLQYFPAAPLPNDRPNLANRKRLLDNLVQSYWKKWRLEYLHTLQVRQKWCTPDNPVKVGTVVLVGYDDLPPLQWPLGIITRVYPGADNVVRVALVKTESGEFKRPVVKLYPLPTQ